MPDRFLVERDDGSCAKVALPPYPTLESGDGSITIVPTSDPVTGQTTYDLTGGADTDVSVVSFDEPTRTLTITEDANTFNVVIPDADTFWVPTITANAGGGIDLLFTENDESGATGTTEQQFALQERLLDSCGDYVTLDTNLRTIAPTFAVDNDPEPTLVDYADPAQNGSATYSVQTPVHCATITNNECVPMVAKVTMEQRTLDVIMGAGIASFSSVFQYSLDGGTTFITHAWTTADPQPDQSTINRDTGNTAVELITLAAGASVTICLRQGLTFDSTAQTLSQFRTLTPSRITWELHEA